MGDELKSAYELAMERLRARDDRQAEAPLSPAQKERVAEVRAAFRARRAELEILHGAACAKAAADPDKLEQLEEEFQRDRARLEQDETSEIEKIRISTLR